jgi:hypothetical protein
MTLWSAWPKAGRTRSMAINKMDKLNIIRFIWLSPISQQSK